jgi:hypothetical protein
MMRLLKAAFAGVLLWWVDTAVVGFGNEGGTQIAKPVNESGRKSNSSRGHADTDRPSNRAHAHKRPSHRAHAHKRELLHPGAVDLIPGKALHGAIIVSKGHAKDPETHRKELLVIKDRVQNVQMLMDEIPFPLTQWSAVFTSPCPIFADAHASERGLVWAHYRIIREFTHFDREVLAQIPDYKPGQPKVGALNHTIYSQTGPYAAYSNGSLYKDGVPFREDDIITIFEDDAESAINDLNTTILEEFQQMNTDILFLGWCEGRSARPVPLCTHAYALTRRGARKIVRYLEPCGMALDEQFVIMARNNFITWRRAATHSYSHASLNDKYKSLGGEKTYGIFHQNNQLGSINGHRRRHR